jgi:AcrR family transcriptional regulator
VERPADPDHSQPAPRPDAREAMLRAGALALQGSARDDPLRRITLHQIAARAGFSRSTAYRLWDSKADYLADLTQYLLGDARIFAQDATAIEAAAHEAASRPISDALMHVATADLAGLVENQVWQAEALMLGYLRTRKDLHVVAVEGYKAVDAMTYGWYEPLLAAAGRRPRHPLTDDVVGSVLQALAEGAGLREVLDEGHFLAVGDASESGPLYGYAIAALLAVLTADGEDDRSVAEVLADLLGG